MMVETARSGESCGMKRAQSCSKALSNRNIVDPLWGKIVSETSKMAEEEPILRRYYWNTVLQYESLERCVIHHLASKLANDSVSGLEWYRLFESVVFEVHCETREKLGTHMRHDIEAVLSRDPACVLAAQALLTCKGYLGLQAYRISHELWVVERRGLSIAIQSRVSEIFGMDIHPACIIGSKIMMDHATGIVIGETARVGDGCTLLHGVTLGGTGKERGDRHPKIGNGTLIGACALVLGNINIGAGCKIAAGSVVLKSLPPHSTAAGVPAKIVGLAREETPGSMMDSNMELVAYYSCPVDSDEQGELEDLNGNTPSMEWKSSWYS
eukprot:35276_1